MYVQCPQCETLFRVSTEQLTQADGLVRCGECNAVFDGMKTLTAFGPERRGKELSEYPLLPVNEEDARQLKLSVELEPAALKESKEPDDAAMPEPQPETATDTPPAAEPVPETRSVAQEQAETPGPQEPPGPTVPRALAEDLAAHHHVPIPGTWLWTLIVLILIALLAGQYIYAERESLYRYPELQPWVERFCKKLGCELSPRRDLDRIELLSRNIFSHPNEDNALMITANVVNNAPFAQPYPRLQVSLSDLQGRLVARRSFEPSEYLPGGDTPPGLMEPGVPETIRLEILDPGSHALAFEFEFL